MFVDKKYGLCVSFDNGKLRLGFYNYLSIGSVEDTRALKQLHLHWALRRSGLFEIGHRSLSRAGAYEHEAPDVTHDCGLIRVVLHSTSIFDRRFVSHVEAGERDLWRCANCNCRMFALSPTRTVRADSFFVFLTCSNKRENEYCKIT